MVVELDRGRPDDAPPRGAKPDAKIDIVKRNGKSLIETALRKENIAADSETTRGHAGQILLETGSTEVSVNSARLTVKGVTCDSAQAQDDAGMLNGVVGVVHHCPDGSHAGEHGARDQAFEPGGGDDLGVVVEETQHIAGGFAGAPIVHPGVIEWSIRVRQHANARSFRRRAQQLGPIGIVSMELVDKQEHLEVLIGGARQYRVEARSEQ
jgi:hypothetical protein